MSEDYEKLRAIAADDVVVLEEKGRGYGGSWKKRGGVGAMMMLARKWDRLEIVAERYGYDIFKAIREANDEESLLDTLADLRRYLLLVEGEVSRNPGARAPEPFNGHLHPEPSAPTMTAPDRMTAESVRGLPVDEHGIVQLSAPATEEGEWSDEESDDE